MRKQSVPSLLGRHKYLWEASDKITVLQNRIECTFFWWFIWAFLLYANDKFKETVTTYMIPYFIIKRTKKDEVEGMEYFHKWRKWTRISQKFRNPICLVTSPGLEIFSICLFFFNRAVAERAEKQLFLELQRLSGPCERPAEECSEVWTKI